jgi:hypothetical protein
MKKHEIVFLLVLLSSIFTKDLVLIFINGIIYMMFFPPFSEKNEEFLKITGYILVNVLVMILFLLKKKGML